MIAHIVLFEPKPELGEAQRRAFLDAIRTTARNTGSVTDAYVGQPLSVMVFPEQMNGQSTYSFAAILMFSTKEALGTYLLHPAHDELRTLFWQSCQATFIADLDLMDLDASEADLLVG